MILKQHSCLDCGKTWYYSITSDVIEEGVFLNKEKCKILKEELKNHCFSMENKQKTSEIMKLIMELADD